MNGLTQAQEAFLAHFEGVKREGDHFKARCPGHDDHRQSLSIKFLDGQALVHDFGGCGTDFLLERVGLKTSDLYFDAPANGDRNPTHTITIDALARDKKLPPEFLRSLGLRDIAEGVAIPYYLQDGSLAPRQRTRTALSAGEGSRWNKGAGPLVPYGLQKLPDARAVESLVMVEGESDSWTCWFHEIPCLGFPGATTTGCLQAGHVAGICSAVA
jgi:putative DNA primase/helicase